VSTFVLIPGAGGAAWYWHRVTPLLEAAGHRAVAVDLPADDPHAGLTAYAEIVAGAAADAGDLVLVAQSMGAFTALPAAERLNPRRLVLVNAMVPNPGETAGEWWEATGSERARRQAAREHGYAEEFHLHTYFLHDVDVALPEPRDEADIAFEEPCAFTRWPQATTIIAGAGDRFFPLEFQRRVARERTGRDVQTVPGGHLCALSEPQALAAALA
jgi:pimeloyl-ACP methyl ester carboxylesterase